jgi:hypothetical protein
MRVRVGECGGVSICDGVCFCVSSSKKYDSHSLKFVKWGSDLSMGWGDCGYGFGCGVAGFWEFKMCKWVSFQCRVLVCNLLCDGLVRLMEYVRYEVGDGFVELRFPSGHSPAPSLWVFSCTSHRRASRSHQYRWSTGSRWKTQDADINEYICIKLLYTYVDVCVRPHELR